MMHWPQLMQLETFSPSSKAVPILAREPRPMKSMAATPWTSSQTRTHLPHRMHLAGSRTIDGLDMSRKWRLFSPAIPPLPHAQLARPASCSWQLPLRTQYRQSSGWLASSSSTIVLPGLHRPGRMRLDLHAVGDREGAAGHQSALAFDLDHAHPAGAAGQQAVHVAQRGDLDAGSPQRLQQHLARLGLDRPAVDFNRDHVRSSLACQG